jgi:TetR/AcrR family transcriptional repressor of nem operon
MQKQTSRDKLLDVTFEEVYRYGYHGASTASILKKAGVPKGSMYHHFSSKQGMVLAMIEERLIPRVRDFFDFEMRAEATAIETLKHTMHRIAHNSMLVQHGCPLHRLMFEMEGLDSEIALACEREFDHLTDNLAKVLRFGMREGSIVETDAQELAGYIIASSWGFLSRPMRSSSREQFLQDSGRLLKSIRA